MLTANAALMLVSLASVTIPSWDAPLECPDPAWVHERVESYLRRPLRDEDAAIQLDARVSPSADGRFEVVLTIGEGESREHHYFAHHDCAELAEFAASLTAITIDPLALVGPAEPPPRPAASPGRSSSIEPPRRSVPVQQPRSITPTPSATPSTRATPPIRDPPPAAPPAPEPALARAPHAREQVTRLLVLADAGLALGVFPQLAPTIHAGLGLDTRARPEGRLGLQLSAEAGVLPGGRFRSDDGSSGGDLLAWDVVLRPCLVSRWPRQSVSVALRACAVGGFGQLRGRGVGVQDPQLGTQPWIWAAACELGRGAEAEAAFAALAEAETEASPTLLARLDHACW